MKTLLIAWLLSAMAALSPPHRKHFAVEAQESFAQEDARRQEIAEGIIEASFDPDEKPLFGGPYGRSRTAFLITFKFWMESGFRRDVHLGLGRARTSRTGLNDYGRSWCMGQIMLGSKREPDPDHPGRTRLTSAELTAEGWSGLELLENTERCALATKHRIAGSLSACSALPWEQRLADYVAGDCSSEIGQQVSADRLKAFQRRWARAWASHPKLKDADVLASPQPTDVVEVSSL